MQGHKGKPAANAQPTFSQLLQLFQQDSRPSLPELVVPDKLLPRAHHPFSWLFLIFLLWAILIALFWLLPAGHTHTQTQEYISILAQIHKQTILCLFSLVGVGRYNQWKQKQQKGFSYFATLAMQSMLYLAICSGITLHTASLSFNSGVRSRSSCETERRKPGMKGETPK